VRAPAAALLRGATLALLGAATASCSEDPVVPTLPVLEAVVASGDEQYGTVGVTLSEPLRVVVRLADTQAPRPETNVRWEVESGVATLLGPVTAVTDSIGATEIRVRLGATTGAVVVRATVVEQEAAFATFGLFTVDPPVVDDISPAAADAGDIVTITGSNFSPNAEQNVVLFSGIRGVVTAASPSSLQVEVPACLPTRDVQVGVQLGTVGSGTLSLSVTENGEFTSLPIDGFIDVADDAGYTCLRLPGGADVQYLTIVYSASTVGGAMHPFTLRGLSSSGPLLAVTGGPTGRGHQGAERSGDARQVGPGARQAGWDARLRTREAELVRGRPDPRPTPTLLAPLAVPPQEGDLRTFNVYDGTQFDQVTAEAVKVGSHAALFIDQDAPAEGLTDQDLQDFADRFDDVIRPTVTGAFGDASDLDANERVIVLFTPRVNALTPAGGNGGFVGGFFFGLDLQPGETGSNGGEIFYALVPDPDGEYSDARSKDDVLRVTPAILAHEFQHMVHYNERILERGAPTNEALWLSEALAQMAEDRVARAYESQGDDLSAEQFRNGNWTRADRYLGDTPDVSLIVGTGQGSLEERGAGFLYLLYLTEQEGEGLLGALTRTTSTGVANVEARTGASWPDLVADWWSAVYLDGPGPESGPMVYPQTDLRALLESPFPLEPTTVGSADFTGSGALWSSSAAYYILVPGLTGSSSVRLGGEAGSASAAHAALRMRVIRLS
jgi:hypothetical protein